MIIKSSQGDDITIDESDFEKVGRIKWSVRRSKRTPSSKERISIRNTKVGMSLARFLMDCPDGLIVDHINRDPFDNRKENLRVCTVSQNNANKVARTKSGHKGVYIDKVINGKTWYDVAITVNKKYVYLGYVSDPKEGAILYNNAALKYFNGFAHLNEVD